MMRGRYFAPLLALIAAAPLPEPSSATVELHRRWLATTQPYWFDENKDELYRTLLHAPDADLVFLRSSAQNGDSKRLISAKALGSLNTDRTFEVIVSELTAPGDS